MKSSKEFFDRLRSDEEFAKEAGTKAKEKIDAGEDDYKSIWMPIAAEYGYELNEEELEEMFNEMTKDMSDEELGKAAGGTSLASLVALGITGTISIISTGYIVATAWMESKERNCY